tara:strand:+ start:1712 stop:1999 length:288 start_codon:yes stop_codon:yes gene_type:complete
VAAALVVHLARLVVHPAVVRLLAGHRAVAHPLAAVHRAADPLAVAPRVAACRAEAREAVPAVWKAEILVDRAMVRWQAATQDSVTPLVAISHCPA